LWLAYRLQPVALRGIGAVGGQVSKDMRILNIVNNYDSFNGCLAYRVLWPLRELGKRGYEAKMIIVSRSSKIDEETIDWCDVVVFNWGYDENKIGMVKEIFLRAKLKGKGIIYQMDDDLEGVMEGHPIKEKIDDVRDIIRFLAQESDAMVVTTEDLKEIVKRRYGSKNIEVVPNALPLEKFNERERKSERLKIGWSGGHTHLRDLLIVTDVIQELQKKYDFDFVVQGITLQPLDSYAFALEDIRKKGLLEKRRENYAVAVRKLLEECKKIKNFEHIPFYPVEMFPEILRKADLDIGICPLEEHSFNEGKSCVKFYEYAAVGTVTIASDVIPYKREVNYRAKNTKEDWYEKLEKLIVDNEFRERILEEQRKFVFENRDLKKVVSDWENVFKKYVQQT